MQPYEVKIRVSHEVLLSLHKSLGEAAEDIRRQAAIRYYKKRALSLGKAADLAGMSRFEFIDYLRFNDEPVFQYTDEELEEIKRDAAELAHSAWLEGGPELAMAGRRKEQIKNKKIS